MSPIPSVTQFLHSGFILSCGNDELWLGWGTPKRLFRPTRNGFYAYAPDFFLRESAPWWSFPHWTRLKSEVLNEILKKFLGDLSAGDFSNSNWLKPDFDHFSDAFYDLKKHFNLTALKKVVPVVFEKLDFKVEVKTKASWLLRLLSYSNRCPVHLYGIWSEQEGMMGATPELLFKKAKESQAIHALALAGTCLKGSSQLPLLEDKKQLEEHRIVIEGISSSLNSFGKIQIGETSELNLPTLSHLQTPVFLFPDNSFKKYSTIDFFEEIVRKLHPTPALGAFPRAEGLAWLENYHRKSERYRFGAPFGTISEEGEIQCIVAIRNLQWNSSEVILGAGCGVIEQSDLYQEWREIQGKIESVKSIFGLVTDGNLQ